MKAPAYGIAHGFDSIAGSSDGTVRPAAFESFLSKIDADLHIENITQAIGHGNWSNIG